MSGFSRVAILGLGVMGGSLARALANRGRVQLRAFALDEGAAERAVSAGVLQRVETGAASAVEDADLVVLATPVAAALDLLGGLRRAIPESALVTDVCSVKAPLMDRAMREGLADRFVGSHPMCGATGSGWASSRADLYHDARVWIVPGPEGPTHRVEDFWRAVGARPERVRADVHDAKVAWTSHLPQLLSSAMGTALGAAGFSPSDLGPGGRDVTRLAASSPELWADILVHNREALEAPLASLRRRLDAYTIALRAGDGALLRRLLSEARRWSEPGG